MRRCKLWLQGKGLTTLISAVSSCRVALASEDVYKICALLKAKEDTLHLQTNQSFIHGLHVQYKKLDPEEVTPFQKSFIDGTFAAFPLSPDLLVASSQTGKNEGSDITNIQAGETSISPVVASGTVVEKCPHAGLGSGGETEVEERLAAVWDIVQECQKSNFIGTDGIQKIQVHCKALERHLRRMRPFEIVSLVRALATINYQDYALTNLLARRSCEVASKLSSSEVCRTYFNLSKLQSHDSMVAFVNQIEIQMDNLHRDQVQFVAMALERQPQIASAPARMVPKLLARAVTLLHEVNDAAYHRSLLVVAARYNLRRHPAVPKIIANVTKHLGSVSDRDLLTMLQSAVDLEISAGTTGMSELLERTETAVDTVEVRSLDTLVDILSVLPVDTGKIMERLLNRLTVDAGKLSIPQLALTLDLLSGYPAARGHPCIAALAFAASMRADSFDGEALEQLLLNLGQLGQFSDDFYALVQVLQNVKGGFRSAEKLFELMRCCTRDVVSDVRGQDMITRGILGLAPGMNDENLSEARKLLVQLGVDDKNVHQIIFRRAKQIQRESGSRWGRRGYDVSGDTM